MNPLLLGGLISGGAQMGGNLAGGLLGYFLSKGDYEKAREEMAKIVKLYEDIGVPPIEAQQIVLDEYKSQGVLTPEMEQLVTLGPSEMQNISTDPRLKDAQMAALSELERMGEGGLRLSDQAAIEQVMGQQQAQNRGAQDAIVQSMKERGAYGSGNELATRLLAQQESANRAHSGGLQIASDAADRALSAMLQGGELAGNIRGQEFGEKSQVAQAQDAINAFNAQNKQGLYGRNTDRRNTAQEYNLGEAQRIADANTGLRNQQEMYNKNLYQQKFENDLARAGGLSSAYAGQADVYRGQGDRTSQMWGKIGQGVGQAGSAFADIYGNKKKWGQQ